jgi:hypothetical protein
MAKRTKDEFTRDWIIENSVEILSRYEPGVLTIRALHYQLVSIGMTNTLQHYKRVVAAMEVARWDGLGQVELDAVKPEKLIALLDDAINEIFDQDLYDELIATEAEERELFQAELKRYVEEDL